MTRVGHGFWRRFWRRQPVTGRPLCSHMGAPGARMGIAHCGKFDTGLCLIPASAGDPNSGCWHPHRRCHRGIVVGGDRYHCPDPWEGLYGAPPRPRAALRTPVPWPCGVYADIGFQRAV